MGGNKYAINFEQQNFYFNWIDFFSVSLAWLDKPIILNDKHVRTRSQFQMELSS